MNKNLMIMGIIAAAIILNACQQEMVPKTELKETTVFENAEVITEAVPGAREGKEEVYKKPLKQTESQCRKQWEPLIENPNPLLSLEEGMIIVTFAEGVSLNKAVELLEKHGAEKEEIRDIFTEMFPSRKKESEEEMFNRNKNIKGRVKKGEEVTIACKLLREKKVEAASPSFIVDIKKLAEAQQQ